MMRRNTSSLSIARPRQPLPSVEIDLEDIPVGMGGYSDLVVKALAAWAEESDSNTATIYVHQDQSVNFHELTWSAFFALDGDERLLNLLLHAFQSAQIRARISDQLDVSRVDPAFHIEDGKVWQPYEMGVWFADA